MDVAELTVRIPAFLLALTLHEYMHAWAADRFGDPTARLMGRLSFNPLAHLDPMGTVLMIFAGFGWGKPVPVDPSKLRDPRKNELWISLAGPLSNLALVAVVGLILRGVFLFWRGHPQFTISGAVGWLFAFMAWTVVINAILAAFNLIPIPPLDGSKVLSRLLPGERWEESFMALERFGGLGMLLLLFFLTRSEIFQRWILWPLIDLPCRIFVGTGAHQLMALGSAALQMGGAS
jgi:Zn-dependent protease